MASGVTNREKFNILGDRYRGVAAPANYHAALVTDAVVPGADINTLGELTQIATGNGYTDGGVSVALNATDWDTLTEDDANDRALAQLKDQVWTASGGPLPASGAGASYMVLTGPNATVADREVLVWWDLVSARSVSDGQSLTIQDAEVRLTA